MSHIRRLFSPRRAGSNRANLMAELENVSELLTEIVVAMAVEDISDVPGADRAFMKTSDACIALAESVAVLRNRMTGGLA